MDGLIALALAKKYTDEHGGGLPEVTTADNGKVLGVEAGAWTKITPESGTIPTIMLDMSQIISFDDGVITAQLTAEQEDIFNSDAPVINMGIIEGVITLFTAYRPGDRSTALSAVGEDAEFMYVNVQDGVCRIYNLAMPDSRRYNLSYTLATQRFNIINEYIYKLAHNFTNTQNYQHQMPQLRVDDSLNGMGNYTVAFHCSSITPITNGYHCVFIHDEYDIQASKMAYTVFSFDIDSSYNLTNQSYTTHYAV